MPALLFGSLSFAWTFFTYDGSTIFPCVYDDRLTIWNPGGLPDDLTMEQLKNKHRSIPSNRLIADVFFMAGYIEAWGRGIEVMQEGCGEYGIPDPIIAEEQGGIEVTLLKDIYTEENLRQYDLEARHIKALLFTKENGRISNSEYQKLFNVSKRTVSNDLQLLIDKKLLDKMGTTGRGTYYILQRGNKGANYTFSTAMPVAWTRSGRMPRKLLRIAASIPPL